jgi:hypothetical protein
MGINIIDLTEGRIISLTAFKVLPINLKFQAYSKDVTLQRATAYGFTFGSFVNAPLLESNRQVSGYTGVPHPTDED